MVNTDNIVCAYESEVVSWIKENYQELGYNEIIEENRNKVPDFVMVRGGKKVRVEVEVYSSSFIKHKHDHEKVDEVLCVINDVKLPVKTIKIEELKLWYQLQGDELVDFFKTIPDSILVDHRSGQTIYHFQDDWINLSKEEENAIRERLRMQSRFLNNNDAKELKEKVGNIFG